MKKGLLVLVCFLSTLHVWSLNYCQTSAFGYGAAATGGGNATPTLVSSYSDLKNALKSSNKVIIITQSITFGDDVIECSKSNITILGMPGVTLKAKGSNCGIFKFKGGSNYILRNLVLAGPGSDTQQAPDLLCFEGASKAWVDHCDFKDGADGNFDICKGADNITVSWCRFRYTQEKSHNFSNLIGSSATDKAADGTFNVTYLGCWWDNYCQQRMTRSRNASLHFVNCYWNSSAADYYIGLENSDAYIEGCYFGGSLSGGKIMGTGNSWYKDSKNGYTFVNCHSDKSLPSNVSSRTVVIPTYTYPTPVSYSEAKTMVTNTTCGAGATLTVTTAGAVSSSCDGDQPQPEAAPTLNDPSNKSQSVSEGSAIAAITFTASGTATAISVSNLPAGLTSNTNGLSLTISGTPTASGTYTITATNASGTTATKQGTISVSSTPGPGPTPQPGEHSFSWNISDPAFAALAGDITSTTTVNGLTMVATSGSKMTIDEQEAKYGFAEGDTVVFTNRLKTGGSGKTDSRHIKFAVTGPCTIEVWAKSSSSSEDRTINIYTNSVSSDSQIGTLPALGSTLVKQSFNYTGGPTTIVMGSASSGINFYAINIVYPTSPTALSPVINAQLPHKLMRRGQLFILHHGRYYNVLGQPLR